jgi:hypothetical protein
MFPMKLRKRFGAASVSIFVCLTAWVCGEAVWADEKLPPDIAVTAVCSSGYSNALDWITIVSSDGTVVQKFLSPDDDFQTPREKKSKLSDKDLRDLFEIIKQANFQSIPTEIEGSGEDQPVLQLTIKYNGKERTVKIFAPAHVKESDRKDRNSFMSIWNGLCKKVPPPD